MTLARDKDIDDPAVVQAEQDALISAQSLEIERLRNEIGELREELAAAQLALTNLNEASPRP